MPTATGRLPAGEDAILQALLGEEGHLFPFILPFLPFIPFKIQAAPINRQAERYTAQR
jgi:hypothetical protein